jgi:hypothetical protein
MLKLFLGLEFLLFILQHFVLVRGSPISEITEEGLHGRSMEADDEHSDDEEFRQRLLRKGEQMEKPDEPLLTREEKGIAQQRPYSSFHRKNFLPGTCI